MAQLYEILGLPVTASTEQLASAIAEQRRAWRRRINSPDITARQDAERRMHHLDEAERILLDADRRAEYDATNAGTDVISEGKSIVQARQQLARGQHGAAIYTAKRAVEEDPDNAYAYSVLAEAAVAGGDEWLANEAIEKALRLEPEDARLHSQRAGVLVAVDEPGRALVALRTAISLDPAEPEYPARLVHLLVEQEEFDQAVTEGEQAYRDHPDDGEIRTALATALAERAVIAQHELPDGQLVITTLAQASQVEALCDRALSIEPPDPVIVTELRKQRNYARKAKRRRFSFEAFKRRYRLTIGLAFLAAAGVCCLPNLGGDDVDATTKTMGTLLSLGVIVAFGVVFFVTAFEPQYVRNAALIERAVPRRMGRGPSGSETQTTPKYAAVRPRSAGEGQSASKRHRQARRAADSTKDFG